MKIMKKKFIMLSFVAAAIAGCSKDHFNAAEVGPGADNLTANQPTFNNEFSTQPYKLNVIYFLPQDVEPFADFKRRISTILLQTQGFFAENLEREGFGRTSFGLDLLAENLLNIDTVRGEYAQDYYSYSGGGSKIIPEIEQFFAENKHRKKSEHTLVIVPSRSGDPLNPGGVPFYGLGKYCFALDYPYMDVQYLGQDDVYGNLATKWIGGLIHELGHGLNAPHNKERKSEQPTLGTALMGSGNHTYGKNPTFITAASAATFANSQTFSKVERTDWYDKVTHNLSKLNAKFENGSIIIDGQFSSDHTVTDINFYHDPAPSGGNKDYDTPTWTVKPDGDTFHVVSPLSDFYTLDGLYQLRIRFYHENGSSKTYSFQYEFINGIPQLDDVVIKELLSRDGWSILEADSEEDTGAAAKMLDGDQGSVWHTEWKQTLPNHPHHFVLDMGAETTVDGFAFLNRSNLNGAIKDCEVFTSNDNINWTSQGTYTLKEQTSWQYIKLPSTASARYMKLVTANCYGGFSYTHLAEIGAYSD
ncbi:discoidin domain-containing protein [Sinomicrobium weinanense]|uniref:Discoidin domain-containing protein n=2 Tax=Sinomicrobium weinanense TaxID=2842200 RepID=A0A926Q072_9FLAO|nr:discoidin domain-containing protein [Sinomicrobium weinanense]MBC9794662.1 discoidin domain-containing protein [Sinomicrobium weinanense]MBU3124147.1 discoidin domain-containing protein [Sinomicrobium weinanense]